MSKGLPRSLSRGNPDINPVVRQTVQVNAVVSVAAVGSAAGAGTVVLDGLPTGNLLLLGAIAYLTFAGPTTANLSDTWNGDFSIGSVPNADVDLADAGEADIIASSAIGPAVAEVSPQVMASNSTQAFISNTDGSKEVNLNLLIDAADITDDQTVNITVTGVVELIYSSFTSL